MRPYWVLLALFGAAVSAQSTASSSEESQTSETSTTDQTSETETSTTDESSSSTTSDNNQDTTVTVTETVTGDGSTVSSRTTRTITSTTVIVDVSTVRETTTVTSRDQETATKTEYTTTTIFQKRKRDVWLLDAEPAEAEPIITPAPELDAGLVDAEMVRREAHPGPNVFKRDTITETETVTEGGSDTTVVATVTATVVTASTSRSTTTETITETDQAGASTTVTTTKTFTETSNTFSTDLITETGGTTTGPPQTTGGADNGSGGGGGGLSTGAKAGIGAGAGVAGLAIIAGLAWFCLKKRRGGGKHDDHDDMFGASEVPVGAAAVGSTSSRPMAHQPSTSASYGPNRSPVLPNVAPEGYRGTAMGDGRSGYAKPEPYGAAYMRPSAQHPPPNSVSPVSPPTTGYSYPTNRTSTLAGSGNGADHLPEHQTPAEYNAFGGGRAPSTSPGPHAAELGNEGHTARWQNPGATEVDTTPAGFHQSQQPPPNVYEMPGQDPR